jgi:hypothetical protein
MSFLDNIQIVCPYSLSICPSSQQHTILHTTAGLLLVSPWMGDLILLEVVLEGQ